MRENNFSYAERNIGDESDNLLIYYAGPVKISICGWNEIIMLSIKNKKWNNLLEECLTIAKEAWEIEENQITKKNLEIEIKYNFNNIKLYIEHNIIFL